jgi:hypothetical protein
MPPSSRKKIVGELSGYTVLHLKKEYLCGQCCVRTSNPMLFLVHTRRSDCNNVHIIQVNYQRT